MSTTNDPAVVQAAPVTEALVQHLLATVRQALHERTETSVQIDVGQLIHSALRKSGTTKVPCHLSEEVYGIILVLWSEHETRVLGLQRLLVAALGTEAAFDVISLVEKLVDVVLRKLMPPMLRSIAGLQKAPCIDFMLSEAASCEDTGSGLSGTHHWEFMESHKRALDRAYRTVSAAKEAKALAEEARLFAHWPRSGQSRARDAAVCAGKAITFAQLAIYFAEMTKANPKSTPQRNAAAATAAQIVDKLLSEVTEALVGILEQLETGGSKFLHLAGQA